MYSVRYANYQPRKFIRVGSLTSPKPPVHLLASLLGIGCSLSFVSVQFNKSLPFEDLTLTTVDASLSIAVCQGAGFTSS